MKQTQRLTPFFGLALVVLLAACDQTAPTSPASSTAEIAPESELVQFAQEDGTVLGAMRMPVGTPLPEALRVTEQDGLRTMVLSDETIAARATPRSNGPQSPTMVRGKYCYDVALTFLDPPLLLGEQCDHLTVVDTPGSGPQGHIASEFTSAFTGETFESYRGSPECIESFESGLIVVSSPFESAGFLDFFGTEARFYFPDGTVNGGNLLARADTCEEFPFELFYDSGQEARGRLTVRP